MPGTTTTRNLTTLLTSDVVTSFASTINSITTSIESELNKTVGFYNYSVANSTARNALVSPANGSIAFQLDTLEYWRYDSASTSWKLWEKAKTTYIPTVTNFGSTPTVVASYAIAGGVCYYDVDITIVSLTGLYAGIPTISVPVTNSINGYNRLQGLSMFTNISLSDYFIGTAMFASTGTTITPWYVSSVNGRLIRPAAATGNPFTEAWAVGDKITLSVTYAV
jgi:hypothetical protein